MNVPHKYTYFKLKWSACKKFYRDGNVFPFLFSLFWTVGAYDDDDNDNGKTLTMRNAISINDYVNSRASESSSATAS